MKKHTTKRPDEAEDIRAGEDKPAAAAKRNKRKRTARTVVASITVAMAVGAIAGLSVALA